LLQFLYGSFLSFVQNYELLVLRPLPEIHQGLMVLIKTV
jgi:hypothetical protein